jgi:hypothetical protein
MNMKIEELKPEIGIAYIDMDGVVAWLDKGVAEYNNISLETQDAAGWDNEYWHNVLNTSDIEKFFSNLEWMPNGKKLIDWFEQRNLPISFLTRPIKPPQDQECIRGKNEWLQRQGIDYIPVIFERDKEMYATSNGKVNILIDDHSGNIQKWNDAGGIGIHYRDFWFPQVKTKLEKLYEESDED